jgi:uncharacterized protein YegJ (DUF2314 family)
MRLPSLLFVGLLVAAGCAGAQSLSERAAKDEIVVRDNDDPAMRKALARAKQTLPGFLKLASNPAAGTVGYSLKVGVSDGPNTEYFWVNDFARNGKSFSGILSNEPRLVKTHKNGDRITFAEGQIADWTYFDQRNKKMMGNFTACALLTKEPPAQVAAFKQEYGLECDL